MIVPKLIFQGLENIPIAKANRLLQYPPGMYQYVKKKRKRKKQLTSVTIIVSNSFIQTFPRLK